MPRALADGTGRRAAVQRHRPGRHGLRRRAHRHAAAHRPLLPRTSRRARSAPPRPRARPRARPSDSIDGVALKAGKDTGHRLLADVDRPRHRCLRHDREDLARRQGRGHARPVHRAGQRPRGVGGRATTARAPSRRARHRRRRRAPDLASRSPASENFSPGRGCPTTSRPRHAHRVDRRRLRSGQRRRGEGRRARRRPADRQGPRRQRAAARTPGSSPGWSGPSPAGADVISHESRQRRRDRDCTDPMARPLDDSRRPAATLFVIAAGNAGPAEQHGHSPGARPRR